MATKSDETSDSHTITVLALGVPVGVSFNGARAVDAVDAARSRWNQTLTALEATRHLRLELSATDAGATAGAPASIGSHRFTDLPALLDSLSSLVTLEAIDERSHDLLLLHASGLANPLTGLTVASVAASGTGKTTLSREAAGRLHYVSDETVGVGADLAVVRHAKPLSVKKAAGWVKDQLSPTTVGLDTAPALGLRLARIVLLDRSRTTPYTVVTPVAMLDAIMELLPEISYLSRLTRPLQRLASVIAATGGVVRITYREASTVIGELDTMSSVLPQICAPGDPQTAQILEGWKAMQPPPARAQTGLLAVRIDDLLVDGDTGRAIIVVGREVMLISAIAACLLTFAATSVSRSELRRAASELFGRPPRVEGNDEDFFDAIVDELLARGLMAEENGTSVKVK